MEIKCGADKHISLIKLVIRFFFHIIISIVNISIDFFKVQWHFI